MFLTVVLIFDVGFVLIARSEPLIQSFLSAGSGIVLLLNEKSDVFGTN